MFPGTAVRAAVLPAPEHPDGSAVVAVNTLSEPTGDLAAGIRDQGGAEVGHGEAGGWGQRPVQPGRHERHKLRVRWQATVALLEPGDEKPGLIDESRMQVVEFAVIVRPLGGRIAVSPGAVRVGKRVGPGHHVAEGQGQHRAAGGFIASERQQIRDTRRQRDPVLPRVVAPQIQFEDVAPQAADRLRGLDQQRVGRELVEAGERLRADADVVGVNLRVRQRGGARHREPAADREQEQVP